MFSSKESKDISQSPAPILLKDNYPTAPTITSSDTQITISSPTLQYDIQPSSSSITPNEFNNSNNSTADKTILLLSNNKTMYHYQDLSFQEQQQQSQNEESIPLFYNCHRKPIWLLKNRDWHGMTLIYQQLIIVLSTTPPQFRFTFNEQYYHWQVIKEEGEDNTIPYRLKCYETETKKLIAQLDRFKLLLDILPAIVIKEEDTTSTTTTTTNPFRKSSNQDDEDDPFTTFIILSGLLVNNHIKSLLKSLGGGPEALQMIIDPPAAINNGGQQHKNADVFNHMYNNHNNSPNGEEDDDIASLSSAYPRHYSGHQSLVDERGGNRWSSSAQSFKSIELDPGVWHCWWGYKFWWSWFPCCMPGGCCDRACIRIKGHKAKVRSNTRTLSKQGWKQQHY